MSEHQTDLIDQNLERILRAAGSSLRHYMPSSKDELRKAMAEITTGPQQTIAALVERLTVARTMLANYASFDERKGYQEDAAYTNRRIAEIDSALALAKGGSEG